MTTINYNLFNDVREATIDNKILKFDTDIFGSSLTVKYNNFKINEVIECYVDVLSIYNIRCNPRLLH